MAWRAGTPTCHRPGDRHKHTPRCLDAGDAHGAELAPGLPGLRLGQGSLWALRGSDPLLPQPLLLPLGIL